jgi:beta-glucosidase
MQNYSYLFPPDFVWGVATAAAQIEGAAFEDGKGESIWDRFAKVPGKVINNDSPTVACDHYHRYPEDIALMSKLGMRNYRFSISWPRIYPQGRGEVNQKGLDFYDRLIDTLLENRIMPWATMFHWDLPQALEDEGGWRVRSTAEAFADYAETVVERLGNRVKNWITLNELPSFIGLGYGIGTNAPGAKEPASVLNQAYHHALLAHGYGVRAVREYGRYEARVGLVHNPGTPLPVMEIPTDIKAAQTAYACDTAQILGPLYLGEYPASFLKAAGADAPRVTKDDLELIAQPTDFLGLNIYTGWFVRGAAEQQPEKLAMPYDYPQGALPWLKITPEATYWAVRHAVDVYGVKEIYITENGVCFDDQVNEQGEIHDLGRCEYIRHYLISLHRAIQEGYPARGYFLWSFLDNYEWAEGYTKRFGMVHVDYVTQKRTPKLSAHWYARATKENRIV